MIRPACTDDLPALVDMGERFLRSSPYARWDISAWGIEVGMRRMIDVPGACFLVAVHGGTLVGLLIGALTPVWCQPERIIAGELAWWVEPEHRGGTVAVRLLREFESWAVAHGACEVVVCHFADGMGERVRDMYERLGFAETERSYAKEMPCQSAPPLPS